MHRTVRSHNLRVTYWSSSRHCSGRHFDNGQQVLAPPTKSDTVDLLPDGFGLRSHTSCGKQLQVREFQYPELLRPQAGLDAAGSLPQTQVANIYATLRATKSVAKMGSGPCEDSV